MYRCPTPSQHPVMPELLVSPIFLRFCHQFTYYRCSPIFRMQIRNKGCILLRGICLDFVLFIYVIQHCFISHPSDSTVSEDAGIEPRTIAALALAARRSNHSVRSHPRSDKISSIVYIFIHILYFGRLNATCDRQDLSDSFRSLVWKPDLGIWDKEKP
jgi:hypothetical protein